MFEIIGDVFDKQHFGKNRGELRVRISYNKLSKWRKLLTYSNVSIRLPDDEFNKLKNGDTVKITIEKVI